jgi:hypothetical protein
MMTKRLRQRQSRKKKMNRKIMAFDLGYATKITARILQLQAGIHSTASARAYQVLNLLSLQYERKK